jgi:hypothetical protein
MTARPGPAALALAALLLVAPGATAAPPHRFVVVIANNHSLDEAVKPLRYADDDGVRYYELFRLLSDRTTLFTVLDDETARIYPAIARQARPPVAAAILATLERYNREMARLARRGERSELVFIYAGHGDRDASGEGYVNLQDRRLRRRDLYKQVLAPSRADFVHLIIDACKSYYLVNRRGGWRDDRATDQDEQIRAFLRREDLAAYPRAGVILATSGDQETHEWTRYRGGILSHELRSAIAGAGDINGDGRLEYSELHAFIAAANARVQHPQARLEIYARAPAANRSHPLVDLRQAERARLLRFDRSLTGRFHLEDERGVRVVDLHKARGTRFDLAVDARRAYYLRRESREARVEPGLERLAVSQLAFRSTSLAARSGSIDRSFRRDLFRLPFSRGFYDGFCAQTGHLAVSSEPEDFTIARRGSGRRPHRLRLGYVISGALLDLPGPSHGIELHYDYALWPFLSLGGTLQYGRSSHPRNDGGPSDGATADLERFAVLAGLVGRLDLAAWLDARAELNLGYQGYFGAGTFQVEGKTIAGSDPAGLRLELGLGASATIWGPLRLDLRGGLGVEAVTIEEEEHAHLAPYLALGLGTRF